MLGLWSTHAPTFLLALAAVTTLAFALPIFFVPLTWARWFLWKVPEETDLAVYFGRCLGAFVLLIEAMLFQAALTGNGLVISFQLLIGIASMMVVVHVWGAIKRIQPITETIEIGMWAAMLLSAVAFYPVGA
jgi:hypothetical protein